MTSYLPELLAIVAAVLALVVWVQVRRLREVRRAFDQIRLEETGVFNFLHELGSALSEDMRPEELHQIIVEAAARILNAHGGILYVPNSQGTGLLPSYISKSCPPFIEIPENILIQADTTPAALQSYIKRRVIKPGEGLIGSLWDQTEAILVKTGDPRLKLLKDTKMGTGSTMLAPLVFGTQNFGVLAVAQSALSRNFTQEDFDIFKSIAEQSAFALHSATIYSEAHQKRLLDQDLLVAQEVQRILLPNNSPEIAGYEICGVNIPASRVSGDYYDYITVDADNTGVVIADVSGKGIPAALIMATCRSVLRSVALGVCSPSEVLHRVNRQMYPDINEDMFISMAYLVLNRDSNLVSLCRAGHDAPLHYSAMTETVSKINPPGMAVGIDSGGLFDRIATDFSVSLEINDCLVLYTDGVTEALDNRGFEFGLENLVHSIQASASGGAAAIVARVTDDLRAFIGTRPQNDDITLIVIRKT